VPFFTQKPLLETVKGFLRLHTSQKIPKEQWRRQEENDRRMDDVIVLCS